MTCSSLPSMNAIGAQPSASTTARSSKFLKFCRRLPVDARTQRAYHERMRTALGFRSHSGWAVLIAVSGTLDSPRILERRRIVIADVELSGSRQPYHAAAELPYSR